MQRTWLKRLGGFAVGIIILAVFTLLVDTRQVLAAFLRADPTAVALGWGIAAVSTLFFALGWWVIVREGFDFTVGEGIRYYLAVQAVNRITPLGRMGGEPFMAYMLSKHQDASMEESLGIMLPADLLGFVQAFTYAGGSLLLLLLAVAHPLLVKFFLVLAGLAALSLLLFVTLWRRGEAIIGYIKRAIVTVRGWLDRFNLVGGKPADGSSDTTGDVFEEAFGRALSPRRIGIMLGLSHIAGFLEIVAGYVLLLAVGGKAPFLVVAFAVPFSALLSGLLPLPGGLGGREVGLSLLLALFTGVPPAVGFATALLFQLVKYWGVLLAGSVIATRQSIDLLSGAPAEM